MTNRNTHPFVLDALFLALQRLACRREVSPGMERRSRVVRTFGTNDMMETGERALKDVAGSLKRT